MVLQKLLQLATAIAIAFAALTAQAQITVNSAPAPKMSFQRVQEILSENGVTTIEELLPHLPFSYRQKHVLIYDSHSAQPASWRAPRVVLLGDDGDGINRTQANIVMAYGGVRKEGLADTLEMIEYDQRDHRFNFHSIEFQDAGVAPKIHTSPPSCVGCHTEDRHPIWDSYPHWPGSYSGDLDAHGRTSFHEFEQFKEFFSLQAKSPRYSPLWSAETPTPAQAFNILNNNSLLSQWVTTRNFDQIAFKIISSPLYGKYRDVLRLALIRDLSPAWTETFLRALGPEEQIESARQEYEQVLNDTLNRQNRYQADRMLRFERATLTPANPFHLDQTSGSAQQIARIRLVIENRMGLSMRDWSPNFMRGSYSFTTPRRYGFDTLKDSIEKIKSQQEPPADLSCSAIFLAPDAMY